MTDKQEAANAMWRAVVTGDDPTVHKQRIFHRLIPSNPRCKVCSMPFGGVGGSIMKLMGKGRARKNPHFCSLCDEMARTMPGGTEVELTMLFADIRGSTSLAESMSMQEFSALINRFFAVANRVLVDSDAVIDKLVGDEVVAFYLPGFVGPDHAKVAVKAAKDLLRATGYADHNGAWIPVGVGVHSGVAYFGTIGTGDTYSDFTALGDNVNIAARLGSKANAGEVLVSDATCRAAQLDYERLEHRNLELKGKSELVGACVITLPIE